MPQSAIIEAVIKFSDRLDAVLAKGGPGSGRYPKGSGKNPKGGGKFPTVGDISDSSDELDLHDWGRIESKSWLESLSGQEIFGIQTYTSPTTNWFINDYLRGKLSDKDLSYEGNLDFVHDSIESIDSALGKARLSQNITTFRGMGIPKEDADRWFKVGATFIDKGFVSTTLSEATASNWSSPTEPAIADIVMKIEVPEGTRAAYVGTISYEMEEYELLLPRNSKFKVTKRETVGREEHISVRVVD